VTRTRESSLRTYLLTRIALAVPTVLILLTMVFLLMRVAPGNPIQAALGGHVPQAQIQKREHRAGYDRPILTQYVDYLKDAFTLNLGDSLTDHTPVSSIISDNGAATLELTIAAFFVAIVVGVPVGLVAGRWRDTPWDLGGRMFGIVIYAAPVFFLGFLAQLVFADLLGWLPVSGRASPEVTATLSQHTHLFLIDTLIDGDFNAFWDCFLHLILPAVTLGLVTSGVLIRLVRVNLMQTMRGDYVEAARARGVGERRVVIRPAFRNALVPVITVAGLQLALLLGGAILTEETFNWPGIGFQLVRYLDERDYIAVQGIITIFALAVVAVSVLIDLVNAFVDPRVRYS
jgi:peptide/nickel transport system permease protein